jgi:hypothetical protein
MPDGFEPHTELARIYTLRELMTECRTRVPTILNQIDDMFADPALDYANRIKLIEMVMNRGFGKPRQTVYISDDTSANQSASRVKLYLPENGRVNQSTRTIDAEAA